MFLKASLSLLLVPLTTAAQPQVRTLSIDELFRLGIENSLRMQASPYRGDPGRRTRKKRNIILNTVCILLVLCAIVWTVDYFWRYFKYETTNDAVIDQYISPVGIRVSGYIKEVRFTEHQTGQGRGYSCSCSTTAIPDPAERRRGGTDGCQGFENGARVGYSRIGSQRIVQEANIAETRARLWQLEQDYRRYENLLREESVSRQQYDRPKPTTSR